MRSTYGKDMKRLTFLAFVSSTALVAITVSGSGCVQAQFSPKHTGGGGAGGSSTEPVDALACYAPVPGCTPKYASGALCDPVCQTESQTGTCKWCDEKCSIAGDGTTVCSATGAKKTESLCDITHPGFSAQSDDCVPGNICLQILGGSGLPFCFAHCRSQVDCLSGSCGKRTLSSSIQVNVCDPQPIACSTACCDPVNHKGCDDGRYCYLLSPDGNGDSRTVCEFETGSGAATDGCTSARDCAEGWTCVERVCRQACAESTQCLKGTCNRWGKQYGYCS
jgi:hypothetical protein